MILQGFRAFIKDSLFLGTSKVTLPKLEFITETASGDGILGETEIIAIGQTKTLKTTIELSNLEEEAFLLLASNSVDLTFRGGKQTKTGIQPIKVTTRGKLANFELGDFETAKKMGTKLELITDYISVDMDSVNKLELDKTNNVYKVNGVDKLAELKAALAIA